MKKTIVSILLLAIFIFVYSSAEARGGRGGIGGFRGKSSFGSGKNSSIGKFFSSKKMPTKKNDIPSNLYSYDSSGRLIINNLALNGVANSSKLDKDKAEYARQKRIKEKVLAIALGTGAGMLVTSSLANAKDIKPMEQNVLYRVDKVSFVKENDKCVTKQNFFKNYKPKTDIEAKRTTDFLKNIQYSEKDCVGSKYIYKEVK